MHQRGLLARTDSAFVTATIAHMQQRGLYLIALPYSIRRGDLFEKTG